MEPLHYRSSAGRVLIAALETRAKNEPSFRDKAPVDGFICIIEPERCFFPTVGFQSVVFSSFVVKCRNRRGEGGGKKGGVPQRARLTAECHYHRTAQRARRGGEGREWGKGGGGVRSSERGRGRERLYCVREGGRSTGRRRTGVACLSLPAPFLCVTHLKRFVDTLRETNTWKMSKEDTLTFMVLDYWHDTAVCFPCSPPFHPRNSHGAAFLQIRSGVTSTSGLLLGFELPSFYGCMNASNTEMQCFIIPNYFICV